MKQMCCHNPDLLQAEFLEQRNLPYERASDDEVRSHKKQLSQVTLHVGRSRFAEKSESVPSEDLISMEFHRVPFDQVCPLPRSSLLWQGRARRGFV